jgi:hypothetical protein
LAKNMNNAKQNYDTCILLIYSPYNCYYQIVFNKGGSGIMKTFVKRETPDGSNADSVIGLYSFKIGATSDMLKVDKIVEQIKAGDTLHSARMFDTYNFKFLVDQKKYIDIYGQNREIDKILKILFKYTKGSKDRCGFITLFKKANKN